jgi:hypothetical protein
MDAVPVMQQESCQTNRRRELSYRVPNSQVILVGDEGDDSSSHFPQHSESGCEINPLEQVGLVAKGQ